MTVIIRAIILMVTSMFLFTLADLFVKLASASLSSGMVVTFMGAGTWLLFWCILRSRGQAIIDKSYWHYSVAIRTIGEVIAAAGIIISLSFVPLATVTAILQAQPLFLTAAGALFLGEKVGIRRITAVLLGFLGVLIIIRPTSETISAGSLIVLIGVVGMTMRDVGSRLVPSHIPTLALGAIGAVGVTLFGIGLCLYEGGLRWPSGIAWFYIIAMIIAGTGGVYTITNAMRLGEVSIVSPFRYVKIIFGMGAGVLFLGEYIDGPTLIGSAIVTGAGLYAFLRERALAKQ